MNHEPTQPATSRAEGSSLTLALLRAIALLYLFLLAVGMMGSSFKLLGANFAETLVAGTSNPIIGLFIGVLATSIAQSSSLTTSVVVGLVSAGTLTPSLAVPVVMGANIGTSITNTIVALGHLRRSTEFRRAFAAATVHDIFNWMTVILLLPIEIGTHFLSRSAEWLADSMGGSAGLKFTSPTKAITKPVIGWIQDTLINGAGLEKPVASIIMLAISLLLLFFALAYLTKTMKGILLSRLQPVLSSSLAHNPVLAILFGIILTASVQSSSITTSLFVPMAAAGVLTLTQVYPVTLGANIGTTVTGILAATVGNMAGLAIALAHLMFNLIGVAIFYAPPMIRPIVPKLATAFADAANRSRRLIFIFIIGAFFLLPGLAILLGKMIP